MVAADVTNSIEGLPPGKEVVLLEATDGDEYTSRKFDIIRVAVATSNTNEDAHLNVTFSGKTATINYEGVTDNIVTLTLYGVTGP